MLTSDQFLADIEAFLRDAAMSATAFGRACVRDPNLVSDLRDGRDPRLQMVERVRAFIQSHADMPPPQPADPANQPLGAGRLPDLASAALSGATRSALAPRSGRKLHSAATSVAIQHASATAPAPGPVMLAQAVKRDSARTEAHPAPETRAVRKVRNPAVSKMGTNHDRE
jgi:hypothetical protein